MGNSWVMLLNLNVLHNFIPLTASFISGEPYPPPCFWFSKLYFQCTSLSGPLTLIPIATGHHFWIITLIIKMQFVSSYPFLHSLFPITLNNSTNYPITWPKYKQAFHHIMCTFKLPRFVSFYILYLLIHPSHSPCHSTLFFANRNSLLKGHAFPPTLSVIPQTACSDFSKVFIWSWSSSD